MVAETDEELRLLHDKQRDRGARPGSTCTCSRADELRDFAPYLARRPRRRHVLPAGGARQPGARDAALRAPRRRRPAPRSGRTPEVTGDRRRPRRRRRTASPSTTAARAASARTGSSTPPAPGRTSSPRWSGLAPAAARRTGLHLNVTEPREHVLGPMVQHIGRRLTLKQTANGTFIIGGGWPSRPEPGRAATRRCGRAWRATSPSPSTSCRCSRDVRIVRTWSGVMAFTQRPRADRGRVAPRSPATTA